MKLYHATTTQALESIHAEGLLLRCADPSARIKGVWLHTASQSPWAVLHTLRKHRVRLEDVVVLTVDVPRSWLTRFRTGLWYARCDVPPERILGTTPGLAFSASASQ